MAKTTEQPEEREIDGIARPVSQWQDYNNDKRPNEKKKPDGIKVRRKAETLVLCRREGFLFERFLIVMRHAKSQRGGGRRNNAESA